MSWVVEGYIQKRKRKGRGVGVGRISCWKDAVDRLAFIRRRGRRMAITDHNLFPSIQLNMSLNTKKVMQRTWFIFKNGVPCAAHPPHFTFFPAKFNCLIYPVLRPVFYDRVKHPQSFFHIHHWSMLRAHQYFTETKQKQRIIPHWIGETNLSLFSFFWNLQEQFLNKIIYHFHSESRHNRCRRHATDSKFTFG